MMPTDTKNIGFRTIEQRHREEAVYDTVKRLLFAHGTAFSKKHGNWVVRYCRDGQVVYMDTWNGHIYQAHCTESVIDDGHVDAQLHATTHTIYTLPNMMDISTSTIKKGIDIYKTLLKAID